jgi:hypothetical protein
MRQNRGRYAPVSPVISLLAWFTLFTATPGRAQPVVTTVSGTVTHHQTVTIGGGNFGSKTTPAPVVWEDFSDGVTSSSLIVHGGSGFVSNADNLRDSFSGHNVRTDYKNDGSYFEYGAATAPKWFVQYWIKLASNWHFGTTSFGGSDDGLANVKFFRVFPTGARNYSNVGYALHGMSGGDVYRFVENGNSTYLGVDARTWFTAGVWHCVQIEYGENSGAGKADGTMKLWVDGVLRDSMTTLVTNATVDGAAVNKRPYIMGFFDSWPSSDAAVANMYAYYTDIYVDTSWARVEIGDAATYVACRHREIQPVTAWSQTSLTIDVNQGSFATGATAYVYVTDANGVVNANGYRITIGRTPNPPKPPTGLHVVR